MSDQQAIMTDGDRKTPPDANVIMAKRMVKVQSVKELVTHLIALAIIGSTIFVVLCSFKYVGAVEGMEDAKVLLAAMSGLSGVVVGYYFGRVPAEALATQAQVQMAAAMAEMGEMRARLSDLDKDGSAT